MYFKHHNKSNVINSLTVGQLPDGMPAVAEVAIVVISDKPYVTQRKTFIPAERIDDIDNKRNGWKEITEQEYLSIMDVIDNYQKARDKADKMIIKLVNS